MQNIKSNVLIYSFVLVDFALRGFFFYEKKSSLFRYILLGFISTLILFFIFDHDQAWGHKFKFDEFWYLKVSFRIKLSQIQRRLIFCYLILQKKEPIRLIYLSFYTLLFCLLEQFWPLDWDKVMALEAEART